MLVPSEIRRGGIDEAAVPQPLRAAGETLYQIGVALYVGDTYIYAVIVERYAFRIGYVTGDFPVSGFQYDPYRILPIRVSYRIRDTCVLPNL